MTGSTMKKAAGTARPDRAKSPRQQTPVRFAPRAVPNDTIRIEPAPKAGRRAGPNAHLGVRLLIGGWEYFGTTWDAPKWIREPVDLSGSLTIEGTLLTNTPNGSRARMPLLVIRRGEDIYRFRLKDTDLREIKKRTTPRES